MDSTHSFHYFLFVIMSKVEGPDLERYDDGDGHGDGNGDGDGDGNWGWRW